nr:unnamed protein product [Callosobruchus analis]
MITTSTQVSENITSYLELISHESADDVEVKKKNVQSENGKYKFLFWQFETPVIWRNVIMITIVHIIAVYGFLEHFLVIRTPGIVTYCKYSELI